MNITDLLHPEYRQMIQSWDKFRLTYTGGKDFKNKYLRRFSRRENMIDFTLRKAITYVPAFAKSAIIDIRNSIFQRASNIVRKDGTVTYMEAIEGKSGGVDRKGSSMNAFIGQQVIGELLAMGRVGVYVDMPSDVGDTVADLGNQHPYLYTYKAENILNWEYTNDTLSKLLLRSSEYSYDEDTGLPKGTISIYLYYVRNENDISVIKYDEDGNIIEQMSLGLTEIPFVLLEISESLLTDVADYQIAHLNLSSSDIYYAWKSNYPFYTEQFDPRAELGENLRQQAEVNDTEADKHEIELGSSTARRYPINVERPGFINPSPDPLKVSMEKQDKMKEEVRELINLSLAGIKAKMASAESREIENEGLEAGLANIGLVLEAAERIIAKLWAAYEGSTIEPVIRYPEHYQLKTDETRSREAKDKAEFITVVPSISYQKAIAKDIADLTIGYKVSTEELNAIFAEIDEAQVMNIDPQIILDTKEAGLVSDQTASELLGYPPDEYKKAQADHAARIARIQAAQSADDLASRGVKDLSANDAVGEKILNKENQNATTR